MNPTLVFDIETVPDIAGLRLLHELDAHVSDAEVAEMAFQLRRQKTGSDFMQHHLQRVVAISCALREGDNFKVWSLGGLEENEGSLIQRFYDGIEKYTPQLVSWNGSGFDLPVLHYRGLIHGVQCARYWDQGEDDKDFKWNNYISRYHSRHLDLMDLLAMYGGRANAPLDELAKLIGFPGKLGMDGSKVWEAYQQGKLEEIRNYCETDVANTYLVFARFQMMRGMLTRARFQKECDLVRSELGNLDQPHWREFLAAWPEQKKLTMPGFRRAWLAGGWLLVFLITYLSLTPHPPQPVTFAHADKLEHGFAYAFLSLWFCQLYLSARSRMMTIAALVGLGVGLEFIQGWTGYRWFDVWDMAANSIGVLLGFLLVRTRWALVYFD